MKPAYHIMELAIYRIFSSYAEPWNEMAKEREIAKNRTDFGLAWHESNERRKKNIKPTCVQR